jgi:hypothetical protein
MAGRLFRTIDCYPYGGAANCPHIKIRLSNIAKEQLPLDCAVPIDTGFSGGLMLPSEDYVLHDRRASKETLEGIPNDDRSASDENR